MKARYPIEIGIFIGLLVALNFPISEAWRANFILLPEALRGGEYWRLLTFPWVHISFYHLALDASAFIFLYQSLRSRTFARLQHLILCALFSGLIPLLVDPRIETLGLCGLSGVAHGLIFVCAFEAASRSDKRSQQLGLVLFAAALAKTIFEQVTGNVLFADQHFGNVGTPIASCHFGGAIGAIISVLLLKLAGKTFPLCLSSALCELQKSERLQSPGLRP